MKVWLPCSAQNGCHEAARCPAHEGGEEGPAARDGGHLPALLNGAVTTLEKYGTLPENIHVKTVPGSFELIYGAQQMTKNDGFDAVIILGSVIRGETPHFDYICQGVTYGIARLNSNQNIPVIYGLLTTNDLQQAKDRCGGKYGNKGSECAIDAIKMAKF